MCVDKFAYLVFVIRIDEGLQQAYGQGFYLMPGQEFIHHPTNFVQFQFYFHRPVVPNTLIDLPSLIAWHQRCGVSDIELI